MRQIFALMALLCCSLAGAQTMLPPVWGQQAKTDRLTRAYLTPKRIVWMQGDLKSAELLLREGNGQPDLAGVPACLMKNGDSGTASIILISHRINTLSKADKIIVLDHGRIAEEGTHDQLKTAGGIYQRIYEIQSGGKEAADEQ